MRAAIQRTPGRLRPDALRLLAALLAAATLSACAPLQPSHAPVAERHAADRKSVV